MQKLAEGKGIGFAFLLDEKRYVHMRLSAHTTDKKQTHNNIEDPQHVIPIALVCVYS